MQLPLKLWHPFLQTSVIRNLILKNEISLLQSSPFLSRCALLVEPFSGWHIYSKYHCTSLIMPSHSYSLCAQDGSFSFPILPLTHCSIRAVQQQTNAAINEDRGNLYMFQFGMIGPWGMWSCFLRKGCTGSQVIFWSPHAY